MQEVELMDARFIDEMVDALRPQLKNRERARTILLGYWQDQKAFVWTVGDVHVAANERGFALTPEEARHVLNKFHKEADQFAPVDWFRLLDRTDASGMGRKLTRTELDRFLKTN